MIKINVYRDAGQWFGARWIDGEYDGCDSLELQNSATEAEAMHEARTMRLSESYDPSARKVVRVDDINEPTAGE